MTIQLRKGRRPINEWRKSPTSITLEQRFHIAARIFGEEVSTGLGRICAAAADGDWDTIVEWQQANTIAEQMLEMALQRDGIETAVEALRWLKTGDNFETTRDRAELICG